MAATSGLTCKAYLCLMALASWATIATSVDDPTCHCAGGQAGCIRPRTNPRKEVFVMTNGGDFTKWSWDSFTTVIATENLVSHTQRNNEVMCYTHVKQKKYGFMVTMFQKSSYNVSDAVTERWVKEVTDKKVKFAADVVAVNIVNNLANLDKTTVSGFNEVLVKLRKNLLSAHKSLPVQLVCVVPWKPPCYYGDPTRDPDDQCTFTDKTLYHNCDLILIDATSFEALEVEFACKARATVPFTHVALGVDEYVAQGIAESRIVLGVPWHGFKYECETFSYEGKQDSPCTLKTKLANNKTVCDLKGSRSKISIGQMIDQYSEEIPKSHWSKIFQAPVFTRYDKDKKSSYQVWYENVHSLRLKYQYAHDFDLKGIALYYAEDLSNKTNIPNKGFTGGMWDWVLHGILKETVTQPPPVKHTAGVVAGAAIGCLLLGVALGVIFTCIGLRSRVKKSNREIPFKRDQIEYHDDEDNLHL